MRKLLRITTKYSEFEDRIRIDAYCDEENSISLWFTQRLLIRLAKNCFDYLDTTHTKSTKLPRKDRRTQEKAQSLMQQSAQSQTQNEDPVTINDDSSTFFIKEIDIRHSQEQLILVFRETEQNQAMIKLSFEQLRQWLSILANLWRRADWPMEIWPEWIDPMKEEVIPEDVFLH